MSIPYSGSITRSGGLSAAIKKQIKIANLKAVKSVTAQYDPWHEKCQHVSARGFMFQIGAKSSLANNRSCKLSSVIVNDRSQPTLTCNLVNGETVVIKTANFTTLEVLQLFNKYVTPHAPVSETDPLLKKSSFGKKKK